MSEPKVAASDASLFDAVEVALMRCAAAQAAYLAAVQDRKDAFAAAVRVRATYTEIASHAGVSRGFAHRLAEQGGHRG